MKKQFLILLCACLCYLGCAVDPGECRPVGQEGDPGQGQGGSIIIGPGQGGFGDTVSPQAADPAEDNACDLTTARNVVCLAIFKPGAACGGGTHGCVKQIDFLGEEGKEEKTCMTATIAGQSPSQCLQCKAADVNTLATWHCKGNVGPCLSPETDKTDEGCPYDETWEFDSDPTKTMIVACEMVLHFAWGGSWVCSQGTLMCTNLDKNGP